MGTSRGIPSPTDCLSSELGLSHSCSRTGIQIGRSAQKALIFFPSTITLAKSQDSKMLCCISRKQAGQDAVGFGTKCKINVYSPNKPKVNFYGFTYQLPSEQAISTK